MHKYICLLAGVGMAVLLSQPSTAWAQVVGPDTTIAMSHSGNFTVGVNGIYTIVVSNIGRTASLACHLSIRWLNDHSLERHPYDLLIRSSDPPQHHHQSVRRTLVFRQRSISFRALVFLEGLHHRQNQRLT